MDCPFERGRTLLAAGSIRRRAREKRAARETLEEAQQIFGGLGASLWAARVRDELTRISGRRATTTTELTTTETRLATLASEGLSNREIAGTLHISVHTVEGHLTRIYRKLGIRSRAALGSRLNSPEYVDQSATPE